MIENESLENILLYATDISIVCEMYAADATPTADGFDPGDALACFAAVGDEEPIVFQGQTYKRLVKKFGNPSSTIKKEKKAMTVEFSNLTREISDFEFNQNGFEGLIMVIRLLSRNQSIDLTDTQILFTGKCDKPRSGKKTSVTVTANFILHSLNVTFPRRKFTTEDIEGRVPSDPEFEGFRFLPQYGTVSFPRRERRGGFLGFLGFKKTVTKTLQWSNYSDLDANKFVPECWGRVQIMGVIIGATDVGPFIQVRIAWCEGEIEGLQSVRSADYALPLSATSYAEVMGLVGVLNGPDDPLWVAPGYYSRTAHSRGAALNSDIAVNEPPPDIIAIVLGRKMMTPDPGDGDWDNFIWADNPAAHAYFALTSTDYFKLHPNWIEDAAAVECFNHNAENIFNTSLSDFVFVTEG